MALLRVRVNEIETESAYEYFAGLDVGGLPIWTSDISARRPVWEDATNGTHRLAVSYNAPLDRYFLTTMTVTRVGRIAIYDAPKPWGPWTTLLIEQDENRWGSKVVVFSFVNKWLSPDGRDFVLVYTRSDSWASIEGTFTVSEAGRPLPPAAPILLEPR